MMRRLSLLVVIMAGLAGTALAADVVELPASRGKVTFPHADHQENLKDCVKCHEKGPGKIAEMGKEWAHKTCVGCHRETKGPVKCDGCHKK